MEGAVNWFARIKQNRGGKKNCREIINLIIGLRVLLMAEWPDK